MFTPNGADLKLANSMIRKHRSRAIAEADLRLRDCAERGDRTGAAKWMRVMAVVEFSVLRPSKTTNADQVRQVS
jgi:hypothetical protein